MEWHDKARTMRADGQKLRHIADMFHVTVSRAKQVCAGIECPVDHQKEAAQLLARNMADPQWRAEHLPERIPHRRLEREKFIRAHYKIDMTAKEIGLVLGVSRNAIIGSARDLKLAGQK